MEWSCVELCIGLRQRTDENPPNVQQGNVRECRDLFEPRHPWQSVFIKILWIILPIWSLHCKVTKALEQGQEREPDKCLPLARRFTNHWQGQIKEDAPWRASIKTHSHLRLNSQLTYVLKSLDAFYQQVKKDHQEDFIKRVGCDLTSKTGPRSLNKNSSFCGIGWLTQHTKLLLFLVTASRRTINISRMKEGGTMTCWTGQECLWWVGQTFQTVSHSLLYFLIKHPSDTCWISCSTPNTRPFPQNRCIKKEWRILRLIMNKYYN